MGLRDRLRIDAQALTGTRLTGDGGRLKLDLVDAAGRSVWLSVPVDCVDAIRQAVPHRVDAGDPRPLASWSVGAAEDGRLLLTLRTPDGREVAFLTQPWQLQGMATVATHAGPAAPPRTSVH